MPCHVAVVENVLTVSESDSVEFVLKALKKAKADYAVVLDEGGIFLGIFCSKVLLKSLIPVSVAMADGLQIDVKVSAAPGVAKRYGNVLPLPVSEVMDRKPKRLLPDSPIWEGIAYLTKHSSPIVLLDDKGKFFGVLNYTSLLEHLARALPADG